MCLTAIMYLIRSHLKGEGRIHGSVTPQQRAPAPLTKVMGKELLSPSQPTGMEKSRLSLLHKARA